MACSVQTSRESISADDLTADTVPVMKAPTCAVVAFANLLRMTNSLTVVIVFEVAISQETAAEGARHSIPPLDADLFVHLAGSETFRSVGSIAETIP